MPQYPYYFKVECRQSKTGQLYLLAWSVDDVKEESFRNSKNPERIYRLQAGLDANNVVSWKNYCHELTFDYGGFEYQDVHEGIGVYTIAEWTTKDGFRWVASRERNQGELDWLGKFARAL